MKKRFLFARNRPTDPSSIFKYSQGVSAECLNALSAGDRVLTWGVSWKKDDGIKRIGAWIDVHSADGESIEGKLAKDRDYGDDPILDQVIRLPKWKIWDISFEDPQKNELLRELPRRKYANYCVFDSSLSFGELKVQYVYRVEPCLTMKGDEFPDSGWRINGNRCAFSEDELWEVDATKSLSTKFMKDCKVA